MAKRLRLSLANKLQLSIALAVTLMLAAVGGIVWERFESLVQTGPRQRAADLAEAYLTDQIRLGGVLTRPGLNAKRLPPGASVEVTLIDDVALAPMAGRDTFVTRAIERFQMRADVDEWFERVEDPAAGTYYRYVRAIRRSDLASLAGGSVTGFAPQLDTTALADPLEKVLLIQLRDDNAAAQQMVNLIVLIGALLAAALLATACFWLIASKIVLRPVRLMKSYAKQVQEGDVHIRAEINTGDEYQQLAEMFNALLERWKVSDAELRAVNKGMDLKLGELAESNVALYEANKVKGEFLANVSHELRTPLNSIVGFAEVLQETLPDDDQDPACEKQRRYASNIITSSKRLLDLINDLLDLAKIEAGRLELRTGRVSIADTCEGLVTLIRPMAERAGVKVKQKIQTNLPVVETDAGRLQQIIFNFLSNAVKFTPAEGTVSLTAEKVQAVGGSVEPGVKLSVTDTGPGIDPEDQSRIFEKFTQLDGSHTRSQSGTGLGLTICQELAELLQSEIAVESRPGHGATFSLTIPLSIKSRSTPLMPEQAEHPLVG